MKYKSLIIILSTVILLLLIPLIATQLKDDFNWTLADFLIAAGLLTGTGLIIDYIVKKVKKPIFRIILSIIVLIIFILVWMELAVGIFETIISGHKTIKHL